MSKVNNPVLFLTIIILPLLCVALALTGIIGAGYLWSASQEGELAGTTVDQEAIEANVLAIATNYATSGDIDLARSDLVSLGIPNPEQYVSFLVDRYIQENRGSDDVDTLNLFRLADALGSSTPSMIAALATATTIPTPTLPPTAPPPTNTPVPPTETPVVVEEKEVDNTTEETEEVTETTEETTDEVTEEVSDTDESAEVVAEAVEEDDGTVVATLLQNINVRGGPGTDYPVVGSGPSGASSTVIGRNEDSSWLQVEFPPGSGELGWIFANLVEVSGNTDEVLIASAPEAPATATPEPPAEPTATPEPEKPAVDYVLNEAYLIPNPTYNSCPGSHQIFVTVLDVSGNPLDGVTVEDSFRAVPPKKSGEKGPGKLEYDLWNNGFSIEVTGNPDGSPATSELTPKLSSWDEDIPDQWLVEANYCADLSDCAIRKSNNQLCRGHYSYNVTFQRTY